MDPSGAELVCLNVDFELVQPTAPNAQALPTAAKALPAAQAAQAAKALAAAASQQAGSKGAGGKGGGSAARIAAPEGLQTGPRQLPRKLAPPS